MTIMRWALLVPALLLIPSPFAQAAGKESAADILRKEKKHLDCMVSAVRAMPRMNHVRYGITDRDGPVPIVKFRSGEKRTRVDFQFAGQGGGSQWFYVVAFGGVSCAARAPEVFLAQKIADIWKSSCGVDAGILCS